jgi:hypothetical protein
MKTNNKPLIEVHPDHFRALKIQAAKAGQPLKQLTAVLMEYALGKLATGAIQYVDPSLADSPSPSRKPRKGAAHG